MASSGMLRRVALVRTDVSEELSSSFIRVIFLRRVRRLLVTARVVPSSHILVTMMKEVLSSSETYSCHHDEGGAKFLRNVGSYNSHKA
jgi:hypothetical protein